jgi:flavin reductase (DIM6/NTAB) family NADH-FMN oxidoreductase RutF
MLPDWPAGTVAVLATAGASGPRAIPVSAVVRASDRRVLLGLARRRGSLQRLRAQPRVAVLLVAPDLAVTAHGRAEVLAETLEGAPSVAAVAVDVDQIADHDAPTFAIHAGVAWSWTDDEAAERDAATRRALDSLR